MKKTAGRFFFFTALGFRSYISQIATDERYRGSEAKRSEGSTNRDDTISTAMETAATLGTRYR